jgi:hypothetical protein
MRLGQVHRISPIGLDPLARSAGHQRGNDRDTVVLRCCKLSLNAVTARPGLIAEPQVVDIACRLRSQRLHGSRRVCDLAILIKSRFLCTTLGTGHPGATPRKPAYCETGRPHLRRTSGLA